MKSDKLRGSGRKAYNHIWNVNQLNVVQTGDTRQHSNRHGDNSSRQSGSPWGTGRMTEKGTSVEDRDEATYENASTPSAVLTREKGHVSWREGTCCREKLARVYLSRSVLRTKERIISAAKGEKSSHVKGSHHLVLASDVSMTTTKAGMQTLKACKAFKKVEPKSVTTASSYLSNMKTKDRCILKIQNLESKSLKWAHPEEMNRRQLCPTTRDERVQEKEPAVSVITFNCKQNHQNKYDYSVPEETWEDKYESSLGIP